MRPIPDRIAWRMGSLAVLLLGAPGCMDCPDTEYRGAEAGAPIPAPTTLHEQFVHVSISQTRGPSFSQVAFSITGVDLRWHVRKFRLIEAAPPGRLLFDFPVGRPSGEVAEAASGQLADTAPVTGSLDGFFTLLKGNAVVAEITTDIPGMELIRVPLRLASSYGWRQASCVYT